MDSILGVVLDGFCGYVRGSGRINCHIIHYSQAAGRPGAVPRYHRSKIVICQANLRNY